MKKFNVENRKINVDFNILKKLTFEYELSKIKII